MGASFIAIRRVRLAENQDNIAYSAVSRFRCYLLEMCDRQYGTHWEEVYKNIPTFSNEPYPEWDKMIEEMEGLIWMNGKFHGDVYAIMKFTNHSDCDGKFNNEDCDLISCAFGALLETDIVTDERDRERIRQLVEVFTAGAEDDDCEVEII